MYMDSHAVLIAKQATESFFYLCKLIAFIFCLIVYKYVSVTKCHLNKYFESVH